MAAAPDPDEVLRSTTGKTNFQRVARLLISGGTTLLREIFDQICPPSNLPAILKNPATEKQLKAAKLTKPQWDCLYPSPGMCGKSADLDVTLLFRLLRSICNLIPPATGWDTLPASTDHSLAADLARIKYYRNAVYGHVSQKMEITDDDFPQLWQEIRDALIRLAAQISLAKKHEWQEAIDNFRKDPLTAEDERNVKELHAWYTNDMEVKKSIEELKVTTQEGMERMEASLKGAQEEVTKEVQEGLEQSTHVLETAVREEAQDITKEVQEGIERLETRVQGSTHVLETAVRKEAQEIKDQLGELHQSVDRLSSSDRNPQSAGGLAAMVQFYVDAINSPPAIRNVQSARDTFVAAKCSEVKQAALNTYDVLLTSQLTGELPCSNDVIRKSHSSAFSMCEDQLVAELAGISTNTVKRVARELKESLEEMLNAWLSKNETQTRHFCKDLLGQLKRTHVDPVLQKLQGKEAFEVSFDDVISGYSRIKDDYHNSAKGAKDIIAAVFSEFHPELVKEKEIYLGLLKQLKDFDEERSRVVAAQAYEDQERKRLEMEMLLRNLRDEQERFTEQMKSELNNMMAASMKQVQEERVTFIQENQALKDRLLAMQEQMDAEINAKLDELIRQAPPSKTKTHETTGSTDKQTEEADDLRKRIDEIHRQRQALENQAGNSIVGNYSSNFVMDPSDAELVQRHLHEQRGRVETHFHQNFLKGHVCVAGMNTSLNVQMPATATGQRFLGAAPGVGPQRSLTAGTDATNASVNH